MFTQSPQLQPVISHYPKEFSSDKYANSVFYKLIVEKFFDGILILTDQGELVGSNDLACQICTMLTSGQSSANSVPQEIWRVCQALVASSNFYSQPSVNIESEITTNQSITLRIRVQWLQLNEFNRPGFLVILEDRSQAIQNLTNSEIDQYGLTSREAEIWLLSRANYTRKEIADELGISLNTVKKHLKNIHGKRKTIY